MELALPLFLAGTVQEKWPGFQEGICSIDYIEHYTPQWKCSFVFWLTKFKFVAKCKIVTYCIHFFSLFSLQKRVKLWFRLLFTNKNWCQDNDDVDVVDDSCSVVPNIVLNGYSIHSDDITVAKNCFATSSSAQGNTLSGAKKTSTVWPMKFQLFSFWV